MTDILSVFGIHDTSMHFRTLTIVNNYCVLSFDNILIFYEKIKQILSYCKTAAEP